MVRRLWIAFSLLLLLACLITTLLFFVARSRLQARQQAAVQHSGRRSLAAVDAAIDYESKHAGHPSLEDIDHLKALNATAAQASAQYAAAVTAATKPSGPSYYQWVILLTAILSAPGMLAWAWPRVFYAFPQTHSFNEADHRAISRKVYGDVLLHWQTYVGLVTALVLSFWLRSAFEAVLPLFGSRLPGEFVTLFFFALIPLAYGVVIGWALFSPLLTRDFRRELASRGLCPWCGYDIHATPDRCPECGAIPSA